MLIFLLSSKGKRCQLPVQVRGRELEALMGQVLNREQSLCPSETCSTSSYISYRRASGEGLGPKHGNMLRLLTRQLSNKVSSWSSPKIATVMTATQTSFCTKLQLLLTGTPCSQRDKCREFGAIPVPYHPDECTTALSLYYPEPRWE